MNHNAWLTTLTDEDTTPQFTSVSNLQKILKGQGDFQHLPVILDDFLPINLDEMKSATLLNRIDTKYVLTAERIITLLPRLSSDYLILVVEGQKLNHYRTLYFDTPEFNLFNMHVNGQSHRYKVRSREYLDSHQSYLEVKQKTPKDRTIKERLCTGQVVDHLTTFTEKWLDQFYPYDCRQLEPKIWNGFTRITLVGKSKRERVTLDFNLAFSSEHRAVQLKHLVVAEVKLDGRGCVSPFMQVMRDQRVQPQGFSKYCIGTSMLYENVKKNSLKPQLLQISKISNGE